MAVQAQYPLLLNRDGEDMKNIPSSNYNMFMQPGRFLDQSVMFFNNGGGANPRKRGRDNNNVVNLAQLHNQQSDVVSTGLRLAFKDQEKHHLHHQQQQQQQQSLSFMTEDISDQIKQQSNEIEQILQAQKHYRAIICAAEEFAAQRLREKEIELEKNINYNVELEKRVMQLRVEAQAWQAKARAQESTAVSLQTQLQQAIMSRGCSQDKREVGTGEGNAEDAESAYIDPERVVELPAPPPTCKACGVRAMSVVLLPCRHLCLCTICDAAGVDACPCCFSLKSASVQVYLT
ncbi:hypothetical protein GIB67_027992 [Kingdonia uniflora]|uniref:RING-type domain-containing protein n=1 Tax=Kingdonia uniflora TaxID=39325 RepID=A0A7J7L772_9MAGN|nr:hypothetical protein GIB67_027992 [Kingdonia uniflora]